jgi:hypothetical protein
VPVARAKTPDFAPSSMPKLTQRPLLCASGCFPGFADLGGEAKNGPEGPL